MIQLLGVKRDEHGSVVAALVNEDGRTAVAEYRDGDSPEALTYLSEPGPSPEKIMILGGYDQLPDEVQTPSLLRRDAYRAAHDALNPDFPL